MLDALEAAALIAAAVGLGRVRFEQDVFVQSAVIRWVQVIGAQPRTERTIAT